MDELVSSKTHGRRKMEFIILVQMDSLFFPVLLASWCLFFPPLRPTELKANREILSQKTAAQSIKMGVAIVEAVEV